MCLAEEDESHSEEANARIDCIVRSMVIEEVAGKRSSYDDDDGKDDEEEARPGSQAHRSCVHRDEGKDTAVSKEDKSAQDNEGKCFLFKEVAHMNALLLFAGRFDDVVREAFPVSCNDCGNRKKAEEAEEHFRAEPADDQKTHERPDDHGHISGYGKVADTFALSFGRKDESRHGCRCGRADGKDDAMDKTKPVNHVEV